MVDMASPFNALIQGNQQPAQNPLAMVGQVAGGVDRVRSYGPGALFWFPEHDGVAALMQREPPEHRAALVLSTVGCEWRDADISAMRRRA